MSEYPSYLIHYGIQGQKWGVRRFQNEDGTYTSEGLERRRKLEESGASSKEIRQATKVGRMEAAYNKQLAKQQAKIGKRFDKYTDKILRDKKEGKEISQRRINKAEKLGTEFRKRDYIAKHPQAYYEIQNTAKSVRRSNAIRAIGLAAMVAGAGIGYMRFRHLDVDAAMRDAYEQVFNEAKYDTIKDLKKHKIM